MGYLLLLFIMTTCSVQAMEERAAATSSSDNTADLLEKIALGDVNAVREHLLHGVQPKSRVVNVGKESEHYLNEFAAAAVMLDDASKRFEIVQLLLEHGMRPNHSVQFPPKDSRQFDEGASKKMPMLSYIIRKFGVKDELPREALLLITHGADVKEKDFKGRSPLFHAWSAVNVDMLRALRLSGAPSMELSEDDPYREEIRLLLTDIEGYKVQYPDACSAVQSHLDEMQAEMLFRKRKNDEKFSIDHSIPRSPRKGRRKDERP